jgi:hypothetical protein
VDPLTQKYPYYTPFQFAGNMPIWASDLDGAEPNKTTGTLNSHMVFNFQGSSANLSDNQKANVKQEILARLNGDIANGNFIFGGNRVVGNFDENQSNNTTFDRSSNNWIITVNVNLSSARSNSDYDKGVINMNIGTNYDKRDVSAIFHEIGHIFGLADRYQPVGIFTDLRRSNPNDRQSQKQYQRFNLTGYVPLAVDPSVEPDYYGRENNNLMFGGNLLSNNQLNIMFNSITTKEEDVRTAFLTTVPINSTAFFRVYKAETVKGQSQLSYWKANGNKMEFLMPGGGYDKILKGFYNPKSKNINLSDSNHKGEDNVTFKYTQQAINQLKDAF